MCPLSPLSSHFSSSGNWGNKFGRGATIAPDLGQRGVESWVIVGPLPFDGIRAGGGTEACITRIRDSVDHVACDGTMTGYTRSKECDTEK